MYPFWGIDMHFDKYTHLGNHQPISFPSSQKVPSYTSPAHTHLPSHGPSHGRPWAVTDLISSSCWFASPTVSGSVCSFVPGFFHSTWCLWDSSIVVCHWSPSFSWLENIWGGRGRHNILPLLGIWSVSSFHGVLWICKILVLFSPSLQPLEGDQLVSLDRCEDWV